MNALVTISQSFHAAQQRGVALPALKAALGGYQASPVSMCTPNPISFNTLKGWYAHNAS